MNLLLFSNGKKNSAATLLDYGYDAIKEQSEKMGIKKYLFIPYAVIRQDHQTRTKEVATSMKNIGLDVENIEDFEDPVKALENAKGIMISGGNTWYLNRKLHDEGLIVPIRKAVLAGKLGYIGWSAGTNVSCPSIMTTNDMPIMTSLITPALSLLPFQINPHYIDKSIDGHLGESRDERIEEVLHKNRHMTVVGLREACFLKYTEKKLTYHSSNQKLLKIFKYGQSPVELGEKDSLDFLF